MQCQRRTRSLLTKMSKQPKTGLEKVCLRLPFYNTKLAANIFNLSQKDNRDRFKVNMISQVLLLKFNLDQH